MRRHRTAVLVALTILAAGCDEDLGFDPPEGIEDAAIEFLLQAPADTLVAGDAADFTAEAFYGDAPLRDPGIVWTFGPELVGPSDGDTVRVQAVRPGPTTVVAALTETALPDKSDSADVYVLLHSVELDPGVAADTTRTALGDKWELTASGLSSAGDPIDPLDLAWNATGHGAVSVVTATAGSFVADVVGEGSDTVVVSYEACAARCADTAVITVDQRVVTITVGDTVRFSSLTERDTLAPRLFDANGNEMLETVSYTLLSPSDSAVVVVVGAELTAAGNGAAGVVLSVDDAVDTVTAVVEQVPASLAVATDTVVFRTLGATDSVRMAGADALGQPIEEGGLAPTVTLTPDDAAVADATQAGWWLRLTANGLGESLVAASSTVGSDTVLVRVVPASVSIPEDTIDLAALQDTVQLTASVLDEVGASMGGAPAWTTSDAAVFSVDAAGVGHSTGEGTAEVVASLLGEADTVVVRVDQRVARIDVADTLMFASLTEEKVLSPVLYDARDNAMTATVAYALAAPGDTGVIGLDSARVTARANGTAGVVLSADDAVDTVVAVVQQAPVTLALAVDTIELHVLGATDSARIDGVDALGTAVQDGGQVPATTVTSADSAVASGTQSDRWVRVTASGLGEAWVTASAALGSDSVLVRVVPTTVAVATDTVRLTALQDTTPLTASILDANGAAMAGTAVWSTSNAAVADVDSTGDVRSTGEGTTTIVASLLGAADTVVAVVDQEVVAATLPDTIRFSSLDDTTQVDPNPVDANGFAVAATVTVVPLTAADSAVVDASGSLLIARANGTATVEVAADEVTDTLAAVVEQVAVDITLVPDTLVFRSLAATDSAQVLLSDARGNALAGAAVSDITVSAIDPSVATGSESGEWVVITAQALGETGIQVTSASAGSDTLTARVAADSIGIAADTIAVNALQEAVQLTPTVLDDGNNPLTDPPLTWTTSDAGVVTVSGSGLVTSQGNGTATVTAALFDRADSVVFEVAQIAAGVTLSPTSALLAVGDTSRFSAAAVDSNGAAMSSGATTWASSAEAVATVDSAGLVTAQGEGEATITATIDGLQDSADVRVILRPAFDACQSAGTSHSGSLVSNETWTLAANPHRVTGNVTVDAGALLTIEPGAVVCFSTSTGITLQNGGRLDARGTDASNIVFVADDTTATWSGLTFTSSPADSSYVTNAWLGFVNGSAVYANTAHKVRVDSTVFDRIDGYAVRLETESQFARSEVWRTTASVAAVRLRNGAAATDIQVNLTTGTAVNLLTSASLAGAQVTDATGDGVYISGTGASLTDVDIADVGQVGVQSSSSDLTLSGVTVTGADGYGLELTGTLAAATGVRVTGAAGIPARLSPQALGVIAPTPAEQDSLLGSGVDSLVVTSGTATAGALEIRADLPWRIEGSLTFSDSATLTIPAGTDLTLPSGVVLTFQGATVSIPGTAASPVTLRAANPAQPWGGLVLSGSPADTSRISHTTLSYVNSGTGAVYSTDSHTVEVTNSTIRRASQVAANFSAPGSLFRSSRIDTTLTVGHPALVLGTETTSDSVSVLKSAGVGVHVTGTDVTLTHTRVENSNQTGLEVVSTGSLTNITGLRVINGGSYPAELPLQALAAFGVVEQDSLLGNASDTLLVIGGTLTADTVSGIPALPWSASGDVVVDSSGLLAIPVGTRWEFSDNGSMTFQNGGRLVARGTEAEPITFTGPTSIWNDLTFTGTPGDTSYLTNVVIEHSGGSFAAVDASEGHPVVVDSAHIRQSYRRAVNLSSPGSRLSRSVVDTIVNTSYYAVVVNDTLAKVEHTTIRGAAGEGLWINRGTIGNLRIEGSTGTGLEAGTGTPIAIAGPVRVTGGASYPFSGTLDVAAQLDPDSLLGNAKDTVRVTGGSLYNDTLTLGSALPWRIEGYPVVDTASLLTVEPGAVLAFLSGRSLTFQNGGRLVARGTEAEPITFTTDNPGSYWEDLTFYDAPGDTSYLTNVVIEQSGQGYAAVNAQDSHAVVVDSARIRQSYRRAMNLASPGSRLNRSVVDTTVQNEGVVLSDSLAKVEETTIRGAAGLGLSYQAGTVSDIRILGSGSYPVQAPFQLLKYLTPDSLTGNTKDSVRVTGGSLYNDTLTLGSALPWRIEGYPVVDTASLLTVEPGAVLAFLSGRSLTFQNGGRLVARGTEAEPITFTTDNPGSYWEDLTFYDAPGDTSYLTNVVIEQSGQGYAAVNAQDSHAVVVDSARIRQSYRRAMNLASPGSRLNRSVVDTTVQNEGVVLSDSLAKVEETTIRGAAGLGLSYQAGTVSDIRILGSGSYPVQAPFQLLKYLTPDSLTGNTKDSVRVTGGSLYNDTLTLGSALPWRIEGYPVVDTASLLTVEPGAVLAFLSGRSLTFQNGGRLVARGTEAEPITFTTDNPGSYWEDLTFYDAPGDTSYLTNVVIEQSGQGYAAVNAQDSHAVVVDSARIRQSYRRAMNLASPGSRLNRSVVDTTVQNEGVVLSDSLAKVEQTAIRGSAGTGLHIAAPVAIDSVEVIDSGGDGIVVANSGASIAYCNLVNNTGFGINNTTGVSITAENNWWGDAGGPNGASGDGVSANVDFDPYLSAALTILTHPPN